jgi:NAD(P)-dependent dehydrogenase (short-subunit alcohol dehydrogenase family)
MIRPVRGQAVLMTTALITGANKGIGYETARLLGERGMTVLVGSRDETRGREAAAKLAAGGVDAHFVALDVTDEESVGRAAERIEKEFGQLDVLVNNAGIAQGAADGLASSTSLETMRRVYETNVFGVVAVTQAMLPLLRRSPSARIVNVSSEVGSIATQSNPDSPLWPMRSVPYPSSKAALNMVTALFAKELAEAGIKVNAANPGYCATDLNGFHGFRTAEQGAQVSVHLATLPDDGPTGVLWGDQSMSHGADADGVIPW